MLGEARTVTYLRAEWDKADAAVDLALLSAPHHVVRPFARGTIDKAQSELRTAWRRYWRP